MNSLRRLIRELHRRSIRQFLGVYGAGGWVVLQVVDNLTDSAGLPDWVLPFALVLLLIGLPIVGATAFEHDVVELGQDAAIQDYLSALRVDPEDANRADPELQARVQAPLAGRTARG